jgi:WhiB family transcriptional regulator, redox-sensing transcriptional regulator
VTGMSEPSHAGRDRTVTMPAGPRGTARPSVAFCGWMSRGACLGEDPELFFPIAAKGPALHQISAAKRICQRCAVRALCLTYAVENRQSGIWGGTTSEERFAMREPSRAGTAASKPAASPAPACRNMPSQPAGLTPHAPLAPIRNPSIRSWADTRGQTAAEAATGDAELAVQPERPKTEIWYHDKQK